MKRTTWGVQWTRTENECGWRTTFAQRAWYAHGLEQGGTGKIVAYALYLGIDHAGTYVYQGTLTECSQFIRRYDTYLANKQKRAAQGKKSWKGPTT